MHLLLIKLINHNFYYSFSSFCLRKNVLKEKWSDFVGNELLTSAFGLFTEELPVVFLVTWIENSKRVWKILLILLALGYDDIITYS